MSLVFANESTNGKSLRPRIFYYAFAYDEYFGQKIFALR